MILQVSLGIAERDARVESALRLRLSEETFGRPR